MKTRLGLASAAVAAVTVALLVSPAEARRKDQLPPGSWVNSCWNAYIDDGTLYATCKDRSGRGNDTSIDMQGCRSFSNDDGELECAEYGSNGGGYRDASDIPGNWYSSCQNAYLDRGVLSAECQKKNGKLRDTSLDIRGCRDVENDNGKLVCTEY